MLFHHIFFHKFALAQIWYYFDTCIDSWLMQTCLDEILSKVCLSWPDNEQSSAALHSKLSPLSWLITLQTFSVYQTCIPWLMTWRHKHFTGLNTHQKFYPSLCHHWKCFLCWCDCTAERSTWMAMQIHQGFAREVFRFTYFMTAPMACHNIGTRIPFLL